MYLCWRAMHLKQRVYLCWLVIDVPEMKGVFMEGVSVLASSTCTWDGGWICIGHGV